MPRPHSRKSTKRRSMQKIWMTSSVLRGNNSRHSRIVLLKWIMTSSPAWANSKSTTTIPTNNSMPNPKSQMSAVSKICASCAVSHAASKKQRKISSNNNNLRRKKQLLKAERGVRGGVLNRLRGRIIQQEQHLKCSSMIPLIYIWWGMTKHKWNLSFQGNST